MLLFSKILYDKCIIICSNLFLFLYDISDLSFDLIILNNNECPGFRMCPAWSRTYSFEIGSTSLSFDIHVVLAEEFRKSARASNG